MARGRCFVRRASLPSERAAFVTHAPDVWAAPHRYRHGLYPHSDAQAAVARRCLDAEQVKVGRPVVTELKRATVFWPAEAYHRALNHAPSNPLRPEQAPPPER